MEYRCKDCGRRFRKDSINGRPPVRCNPCRERIKDAWRQSQNKEKKDN